MKRWVIVSCGVFAVLVIVFFSMPGQDRQSVPLIQAAHALGSGLVFQVDDFMKTADQHRGTVRIQGVVSAVIPEKEMFALIDLAEYQQCRVTTCASLMLPVHWSGTMPQVEDAVQIEGEIGESEGKLIFVARTLEKIPIQVETSR